MDSAGPSPVHARAASSPAARLFLAAAFALAVGLTVLHPSATRILAWPWAAFAALGWLLPIGTVLYRVLRTGELPSLGRTLDAGLALLALAAVASALASPLRSLALAAALPVLAGCALPYALLPFFRSPARGQAAFLLIGAGILATLLASALLWFQPWDWRGWPSSRNAFPFGHANTVGSVGVLATTWLAACAARTKGKARTLFAAGTALAIVVTLSSENRGASLALACALMFAAAVYLLRRGRLLLFVAFAAVALTVVVATNARLRQLVLHREWTAAARESNDQRTAMLLGGLRLGAERPLLGWGPGTVPHVFPRVRATLPGSADNVVQLHNAAAQTFATLGATGLLALVLIALGLLRSLRGRSLLAGDKTHDRERASSPASRLLPFIDQPPERLFLTAGLVGGALVLLFDHAFAVPAFAVLAAARVAAASSTAGPRPNPLLSSRAIGLFGLLAVAPVLFATARDLQARAAYAAALDALARDDARAYVAGLQRASAARSADPYYRHQLAAHLATGHPFRGDTHPDAPAAIAELQASLRTNPDLEYAHYNLGWLLLDRAPAEAAAHFLAAARLAPQRGEVYFGLGLARLFANDTAGAQRAFATECLNDPSFAWSPLWFEGPLAAQRSAILQLAASAPLPPGPAADALRHAWADTSPDASAAAHPGAPFRRLRTGYGVLLGHPDGPPPVDVNVQTALQLPPSLATRLPSKGWLRGDLLLDFLDAPTSP